MTDGNASAAVQPDQLCVEAVGITLVTLLNILLVLPTSSGITAPAATTTNPAMSAYSMRSWPRLSIQIRDFSIELKILFICLSRLGTEILVILRTQTANTPSLVRVFAS